MMLRLRTWMRPVAPTGSAALEARIREQSEWLAALRRSRDSIGADREARIAAAREAALERWRRPGPDNVTRIRS